MGIRGQVAATGNENGPALHEVVLDGSRKLLETSRPGIWGIIMQEKRSPRAGIQGATAFEYENRVSEITEAGRDFQAKNCQNCAFYREITLSSGGIRRLCQLIGSKRPVCGMPGCHFLAGTWEELDQILGLTNSRAAGNLAVPKFARLGNGLVHFPRVNGKIADKHTAIHSYAGLSGKGLSHTSSTLTSGYPRGPSGFAKPGSVNRAASFLTPKFREAHR